MVEVGDTIEIIHMQGEPNYTGRTGEVRTIDSLGGLHGTWGGLAVLPDVDAYRIIKRKEP